MKSTRILLVVGVALVDKQQNKVLLAERPPSKNNAGLWEFPGGKVDAGEGPEEALARELMEELNVQVNVEDMVPLSFASYKYPSRHILLPLYLCHKWQGELRANEGQSIAWVGPEELPSYKVTPADVPLVPIVIKAMQDCQL